jgi:hypothetical protein
MEGLISTAVFRAKFLSALVVIFAIVILPC